MSIHGYALELMCFSQFGWTPLFVASDEGHFDIVRILIEAKAQVNTQAKVCCSYHSQHNIFSYKMKMQLTFCSQHGWTALHAAAENGKVDVVRLLIEAKAHVDIKTKVHIHCVLLSAKSRDVALQ